MFHFYGLAKQYDLLKSQDGSTYIEIDMGNHIWKCPWENNPIGTTEIIGFTVAGVSNVPEQVPVFIHYKKYVAPDGRVLGDYQYDDERVGFMLANKVPGKKILWEGKPETLVYRDKYPEGAYRITEFEIIGEIRSKYWTPVRLTRIAHQRPDGSYLFDCAYTDRFTYLNSGIVNLCKRKEDNL